MRSRERTSAGDYRDLIPSDCAVAIVLTRVTKQVRLESGAGR